jgi:hypothetical protein
LFNLEAWITDRTRNIKFMARPKRSSSKILEKATLRAAGIETIAPDLSFGQGVTLKTYNQMIAEMRTKMAAYNAALAAIDQTQAEIDQLERNLGDYSERMLTGVATHYGKNSPEYSIAGGVRKVDRRRRKTATPTEAE